ncbi:MAG TPA: undecaprenyl-diphosphate phosphatase [Mycobacteriales bacterium]|nr:undecaprenyl-diphosphate phosphatase [Mycobacteriales bacterium]
MSLGIGDAIVLGIVEGLTEFLPVSSTGHLTIAEGLLGLEVDDPSVTAFTAVIQSGAIAAVLVYFAKDLLRFARGFAGGLTSAAGRRTDDWRLACAVLVGSMPIGIVGLAARDVITGPVLRSLVTVGLALILWSAVMVYAERRATGERDESAVTVRDGLVIGLVQCVALVPGVSRSGATISAGLLRGIDRVTATRLSFFLAIPALTAAAILELPKSLSGEVGLGPTLVGTAVSFVVAYASIAFLLRFVASNSIAAFVPYRVALGLVVLVVVAL